jgi:imidazolonepropionase-like amidohydrolase
MCLHDHEATTATPPAQVTRRSVLAGAAVMAGVGAAQLAGAGAAAAAHGNRHGSGGSFHGRPPVPPPLVVTGGTLVDPLTGEVTEDATVVLARGKVVASGTSDQTRRARRDLAGTAEQISVDGLWIVPGLVDAHAHVNALADAAGLLNAGATTVRSGSSNFYQDVALRELPTWTPGRVPRMVAAGVFVTPQLGDTVLADPDLAPLASLPDGVQSPQDLRYLTRVNLSRGVDVIKTRANPRAGLPEQDPLELVYDEEQLSAVVDTARRGGAGVLCHAYSAEGCDGAVRAGVRSIEHGVFLAEETMALMVSRGTYFTPTLVAITGLLDSTDPILVERGRQYVPVLQAAVRAAHEMGVPVVAGTDSFGTAIDPIGTEARLVAEAGLPALDALRAATTIPARLIGWEDKVGRLARGYRADLLAVDGSPLDDPSALERVRLVVAQGAVARNDL